MKTTISRFTAQAFDEGRQAGREAGREVGRQKGAALVLLRLLQIKFGPLPEAVRQRIEAADVEVLLVWADRVLAATSLDEVLH